MRLHDTQSIEIAAPYEEAFRFIADGGNLPQWAEAFASVEADRARMRTPQGEAEVRLRIEEDVRFGIVDWFLTFPDRSTASANSRLTRGSGGGLVYVFVLNAPTLPLEALEGALQEQSKTLARELQRLKTVLENDGPR